MTAGHPYYLQRMLERIVERATVDKASRVTAQRLGLTLEQIYHSEHEFHDFLRKTEGFQRPVLVALADACADGRSGADAQRVTSVLEKGGVAVPLAEVRRALEGLYLAAVIQRNDDGDGAVYRIDVTLFQYSVSPNAAGVPAGPFCRDSSRRQAEGVLMNNPFSAMLASLEPNRFYGRGAEIESILRGISACDPRSYAIVGPKTIGTTSLLKHLAYAIREDRYQPALVEYGRVTDDENALQFMYVDLYSREGPTVLGLLLTELGEWIRRQEDIQLKVAPGADGNEAVRAALQGIFRALADYRLRLVICLDHFDKPFRTMDFADDVFLRSLTLKQSFIVATASSLGGLREDTKTLSPLFNVLLERDLGLLTPGEARSLVSETTALLEPEFSAAETELLLELAGRHPYLLTLVGEHYVNLRNDHPEISTRIQDDATRGQVALQISSQPNVDDLFRLFWNPLSDEQKHVLLAIARGERVSFDAQRDVLTALQQKALIELGFGEEQPQIFSRLFADFVRSSADARLALSGLSPLDGRLFEYLQARPNETCTFPQLLAEFWEGADTSNKRGLEAAVHRIRTAIQDTVDTDWDYIQNVRGVGYKYVPKYGE